MMFKKLSKFGNSMALIIDKPILELLDITENTLLKIKTDGEIITIMPVKEQKRKMVSKSKKVQKSFEEVMKKYASALKKLAKD